MRLYIPFILIQIYLYIAPRNLTGRVALTSHEDILLLRDVTNVFVFEMCHNMCRLQRPCHLPDKHNMFDSKILTMLPAPPLQRFPRISHVVEVSLPRFQEIDFLDIPSVLEKVMEKAS